MILQLTCWPVFLMSGAYRDFLAGAVDSTKTLGSRKKCEQFFGQVGRGGRGGRGGRRGREVEITIIKHRKKFLN